MKRESWKVFVACAIGAGIGSLVALEMSRWFWWVGLLVCGLAGYLAYEFKNVVRAIPNAYRVARGWRPDVAYWKFVGWFNACAFSLAIWMIGVLLLAKMFTHNPKPTSALELAAMAGIACAAISLLVCLAFAACSGFAYESDINNFREVAYRFFPPIVIFWHLPRGLVWLVRSLPRAVVFLGRFAWNLFVRIHSERRLLCGVDAMLGAAVGYFAGSAIVGAIAGGLLGLVNYAVVSERLLKRYGYLPVEK